MTRLRIPPQPQRPAEQPTQMVWVACCLKCDRPFRCGKDQVVCNECNKDLQRRRR